MKVREAGDKEWNDSEKYLNTWDYECEETVAERYAEEIYNLDPCDPRYFNSDVEVMNNNGEVRIFECCAEATINFSASEKEEVRDEH